MNICCISMILTILIGLSITNGIHGHLKVVYEWKVLKFDTPEGYPVDPNYTGNTTLITGIEVGKTKIFIATPRFWAGNPASLSWVRKPLGFAFNKSPLLHAYPNWDMHRNAESENVSCDGIISVFRMTLDKCGNLWVLDTGINNAIAYRSVCPPKVLIFNTATDELIRTITLPPNMYKNASIFTNIVLDTPISDSQCRHSVAYMSDTINEALVMYNSTSNNFWRVTNPAMNSDPNLQQFTLFGDSFMLQDGIIGLALDLENRLLYFEPFAGTGIFKVPLCNLAENATVDGQLQNVTFIANRTSQSCGLEYGLPNKVLIYSDIDQTNLIFLNPVTLKKKVVAFSPENLQFVVDLKLKGFKVWMTSDRLQKFLSQKVDLSETNLRIMTYTPSITDCMESTYE